MLILLASIAAAEPNASCKQTWDAQGVRDAVESTDIYLTEMDPPGYLAAKNTVLLRLVCVTEPLGRDVAGDVHRVVATAAYLEKAEPQVSKALAGLLVTRIGYQLPLDSYPEGHQIRALLPLAALLAQDPASRPLVDLGEGWLEVDGVASTTASTRRASIVQQLDGQGAVVETRYVWPDDDLGTWTFTAPLVRTSLPADAPRVRKAKVPLIVATATTMIATGALYGAARANLDRYDGSPEMRDTTNGLTVGYVATGVASVGLGIGLAFAW